MDDLDKSTLEPESMNRLHNRGDRNSILLADLFFFVFLQLACDKHANVIFMLL